VREYLKASDVANNISMLRSVFSGTILVVEGPTDMRLFGKMIDDDCQVVAAHSKDNVRIAVKELYSRRKDENVLGIMDSDMDHIIGNIPHPPLFITDARDVEIMIIRCSALDEVLWEYSDRNTLDKFTEKYGEVRDVIMNSSYPLGTLMYLSYMNDYGLSFKDLDFSRFIDPSTLRVDIKEMAETVIDNSRTPNVSAKTIRNAVEKEMETERDPWIVCRGHDAVQILLLGIRKIFGGYNSRTIKDGEIFSALRLAFNLNDLMHTELYRNTSEWASSKGIKLWSKEH